MTSEALFFRRHPSKGAKKESSAQITVTKTYMCITRGIGLVFAQRQETRNACLYLSALFQRLNVVPVELKRCLFLFVVGRISDVPGCWRYGIPDTENHRIMTFANRRLRDLFLLNFHRRSQIWIRTNCEMNQTKSNKSPLIACMTRVVVYLYHYHPFFVCHFFRCNKNLGGLAGKCVWIHCFAKGPTDQRPSNVFGNVLGWFYPPKQT